MGTGLGGVCIGSVWCGEWLTVVRIDGHGECCPDGSVTRLHLVVGWWWGGVVVTPVRPEFG